MARERPTFEEAAHRREFGDQLRRLRRERGWTQEQLAEHSGVHRSYIASVETAGRNPTLDLIAAFARSLNVPIRDLFPEPARRSGT